MAQVAVNEAVDQLLGELAEAWNAGDARAYGARFCPDVTFTNSDGTVDLGRDEVVRHAGEAFQGVLAGTKLSLAVRKLRLVRPGVAVVDLNLRISGVPVPPPGAGNPPGAGKPPEADKPPGAGNPPEAGNGSGGEVRTSLMLVLVEEDDRWWITAHHNVLQSAGH